MTHNIGAQIYSETRDLLQCEGHDQEHEVLVLRGGFTEFQAKFKVCLSWLLPWRRELNVMQLSGRPSTCGKLRSGGVAVGMDLSVANLDVVLFIQSVISVEISP
jgi:hypothetical protein